MFNLTDALELIVKKPEFSCNERDFGWVIDYHVTMPGSFVGDTPRATQILQNLRGTCFDKTGKIIRLPYHKFHNLNENEEYHESKFDFGVPHYIQEKLDGSMVAPIPYSNGTFRLGTRAGVTDVAIKAENFLQTLEPFTRSEYQELIFHCIKYNRTPIFEYCARDQRIVIDYPVSQLVLTDIRDNETGNYLDIYSYTQGCDRIDLVQDWKMDGFESITALSKIVNNTRAEMEGVVVKFDDGRFVKIKTADYVMKHKAIDGLKFEKDVLRLVLLNGIDDVLPMVTDQLRDRLLKYAESVLTTIAYRNSQLNAMWELCKNIPTRREFAANVQNDPFAKFLFARLDNKDYSIEMHVLQHCSSQTTVDAVRWFIGPSYYDF